MSDSPDQVCEVLMQKGIACDNVTDLVLPLRASYARRSLAAAGVQSFQCRTNDIANYVYKFLGYDYGVDNVEVLNTRVIINNGYFNWFEGFYDNDTEIGRIEMSGGKLAWMLWIAAHYMGMDASAYAASGAVEYGKTTMFMKEAVLETIY